MPYDPVTNTAQAALQPGRSANYGAIQSNSVSNPARPKPMMAQGLGPASPAVGVPPGLVNQGDQPFQQGAFAAMPGAAPTSMATVMDDPALMMMAQDQQASPGGAFQAADAPAGGMIAPPASASRSGFGSGAFSQLAGSQRATMGRRGM